MLTIWGKKQRALCDGIARRDFLRVGAPGLGGLTLGLGLDAEGKEPGHFRTPHALALDSRGCLYVADVMNSRVQKFAVD